MSAYHDIDNWGRISANGDRWSLEQVDLFKYRLKLGDRDHLIFNLRIEPRTAELIMEELDNTYVQQDKHNDKGT